MKAKPLVYLLLVCVLFPLPAPAQDASLRLVSNAGAPHAVAPSATWTDVAALLAAPPALEHVRHKLEPSLLKKLLAGDGAAQPLRAIAMLRAQPNVQDVTLDSAERQERAAAVVSHLQALAEGSQGSVRALLQQAQLRGQVQAYRPLWIVNAVAVEGGADVLRALAAHPDVSVVLEDHVRTLQDESPGSASTTQVEQSADATAWNIARIQADRVWDVLGIRGEGAVVASLDTGVDWEHPYLRTRYRGYTGKPLAEHEGNWFCATNEAYAYPGDGHGHGTHTTGTMVGEYGIGVAPGAQWIAAKVFTNQGQTYDSWIHASYEWVLAPGGDPARAPDVVNSSWGNPIGSNDRFRADVQAVRAAGIVPVFSAGNYGPGSETIGSPASYPESLAVGATDREDRIARFSSRGPSPWDEIKPEVSAPGVDVRSALPGGGLGDKTGTSMAAPHVSGLIALIRQANPALTVNEVEEVLGQTARSLGEGVPSNDFGWGLVDAYAAVVLAGHFGRLTGRVNDAQSGAGIAGAQIDALPHGGEKPARTVTDEQGQYAIALATGSYDLTVSAFGYYPQMAYAIEIALGVTTTLNVRLDAQPTGQVVGSVHDRDSGDPLEARVYVPGTGASASSDPSSGAFALDLPSGTHTVRFDALGHRFATSQVLVVAGTTVTRTVALEPAPTLLLVDSGAWYNDSQLSYYRNALSDAHYLWDEHIIANVDVPPTDVPTAEMLSPYDVVIWSAPQDAPGYIGAAHAITTFLSSGGGLLLSGQDIAFWDGGGNGLFSATYMWDYLKVDFVADNGPSRTLHGERPLFADETIQIAGPGGADNQYAPDVIAPAVSDQAMSAWRYEGGGSGALAAGPCLPYRALALGYGLEAINDPTRRREVLEQSIAWLSAPPDPVGIELKIGGMPLIAPPGGWVTHTLRLRNMGEVTTDTYQIDLFGGAWPTALEAPPSVSLGACQSVTLPIVVHLPEQTAWDERDTAVLTVTSTLSPSVHATAEVVSKTPAPVLLVDGARFYDMSAQYRAAIAGAGVPYDYWRVKGTWPLAIPATNTLAMYPIVVWYTAYDWYAPLGEAEEERLVGYLDGGGRLFLSSQDYLYYRQDATLATHYLGVADHLEDLGTEQVVGEPLHPIGWGIGPYALTYTYTNWSDGLRLVPGARVALRGQHERTAAATHAGDGWRTAFAAFPFETLSPADAREVMAHTLGWLSWLGASTWSGDARIVTGGSEVEMTCRLHNDGWQDLTAVRFTTTLPPELTWSAGSQTGGATYDPATRAVEWTGSLAPGETHALTFAVHVVEGLPAGAELLLPARIGYAEHSLEWDLPYVLRVDAPDLSTGLLSAPSQAGPQSTVAYHLTLHNTGLASAQASIHATLPDQAVFTGTLESEGVGAGTVTTETVSWTGVVPAGEQLTLSYAALLNRESGYWLTHDVRISDQYGERWYLEARTRVHPYRAFLPLVARDSPHQTTAP